MRKDLLNKFFYGQVAIRCSTEEEVERLWEISKASFVPFNTSKETVVQEWITHKDNVCYQYDCEEGRLFYATTDCYEENYNNSMKIIEYSVLEIDDIPIKSELQGVKLIHIHDTECGQDYFLKLSDREIKLLKWFKENLMGTEFYTEEVTKDIIVEF